MGLGHSPSIVVDGLVFYIDPNNPNCYPGFGNTLYNIVNTSIGGTFVGYTSNPIDNTETRSIFFDGTNDFIQTNYAPYFTSDFTLEVFAKFTRYNNYQCILSSANNGSAVSGFWFEFGSDRGFTIYTTGSQLLLEDNVVSLTNLELNKWHHIVATRSGSGTSNVKLYVNNILCGQNTSNAALGHSSFALMVGKYDYVGNYSYFKGNVGSVKIYNKGLSATEILQNYNATKKKYMPEENIVSNGLVLNIDAANSISYSGVGNTWYDITGNARNFSLNNGPTFSSYNSGLIRFDGNNDNAEISYTITFSPITVIVWFNSKSYSSASFLGGLISNYDNATNGFDIRKQGANLLLSLVTDAAIGNINVINTVADNTWYNIAFTYNGASLISYTNGLPVATTALTGTRRNGARIALATSAYDFPTRVYACDISQILIYNRALTQQEISQNYNATKKRFVNALPPVRNGLVLELDAGQRASYPGTGNTWYDLTGNGYNYTLTNGPVFSSFGTTQNFFFDGSNDRALAVNPISLGTTHTVSMIVRPNAASEDGILFGDIGYSNTGYAFYLNSGNNLYYNAGSPFVGSATSTVNSWYMFSVSRTNTSVSLYQNGALLTTTTLGGNDSLTLRSIADFSAGGYPFGGSISQVSCYNRALSAYEIKQNFDYYRTRYGI